ncbi:MAG: hypothetical protein LIO79_09005 [Rikenellaceae bacterium]|nr:hypothetical protein [Rikenellaceae bacterium]
MWRHYDTINKIPSGIWENFISKELVTLDKRLIAVCEEIFPESDFHYFVRICDEVPDIIFMIGITQILDETTGDKILIAETGTSETSGAHFWYNKNRLSFEDFLRLSREVVVQKFPDVKKIIYRDFIGDVPESNNSDKIHRALDLSELILPEYVSTMEDYIMLLRSKYRYQVRQYQNAVSDYRYEFQAVADYISYLDEMYPLYLYVCLRSKEYSAAPYPKEYFIKIKEKFGSDAIAMILRDKTNDKILGFMLLLYSDQSCVHQYIGFERIDELFLWHNLTLKSIEDSIKRGVRIINMGVTNSIAKHKFGAASHPNYYLEIKS